MVLGVPSSRRIVQEVPVASDVGAVFAATFWVRLGCGLGFVSGPAAVEYSWSLGASTDVLDSTLHVKG